MQLQPDIMAIIPLLLVLGMMLKNIKSLPDWLIPWALLLFSGIYYISQNGFTTLALTNALTAVGAAVYGNQLYKQTVVNRITDKTNNNSDSSEY